MGHLVKFFERQHAQHQLTSKNFLWLSLSRGSDTQLNYQDKRLFYEYRWHLKYNLSVRTFFASINEKNFDDDMNNIMLNDEDWFHVNPVNAFDLRTINQLTRKICETPTTIDYDQCYNQTSDNTPISHYISINKKQYWSIYPKFFLYQDRISLKVRGSECNRSIIDILSNSSNRNKVRLLSA